MGGLASVCISSHPRMILDPASLDAEYIGIIVASYSTQSYIVIVSHLDHVTDHVGQETMHHYQKQ